jgi:hypothetical protein
LFFKNEATTLSISGNFHGGSCYLRYFKDKKYNPVKCCTGKRRREISDINIRIRKNHEIYSNFI